MLVMPRYGVEWDLCCELTVVALIVKYMEKKVEEARDLAAVKCPHGRPLEIFWTASHVRTCRVEGNFRPVKDEVCSHLQALGI